MDFDDPDTGVERYWHQQRAFLARSGYRLRPKFNPDFAFKISGLGRRALKEYRTHHWRSTIMDAERICDGHKVMLKSVSTKLHPNEVKIAQFFSSPPHVGNPRNHCIPIFEVLQDLDDPDKQILVMPHFIAFDQPRFDTVGEVVDCFRQIFEGLQYMHENFVAHRDCGIMNLLQDPTQLYPAGFHPVHTRRDPSFEGNALHITRTECWPRFYIIDFGLSHQYDPAEGVPFEDVIRGGDKSPPEHRHDACNPFPTDIYFLGNLLKDEFLYSTHPYDYIDSRRFIHDPLDFLTPLLDDMTLKDPAQRPTISEVIQRFDDLCRPLGWWHLRQPGQKLYWTDVVPHRWKQFKRVLRRVPAVPPYTPPAVTPLSDGMRRFYTQTDQAASPR
ncbi:hypothetical protein DFH07DRAFT_852778, partial [Mycena maculata]